MIRFLVRAMGYLCLAGAFVGVVIDGTRSIAAGTLLYARVADTVAALDPALQVRAAALVPAWAASQLANLGGAHLLQLPLSIVLLALAAILLRLGVSDEPEIGIRTR